MVYKICVLVMFAVLIDVTNIDAQDPSQRGHSPFYWQPKLILTLVTPRRKIDQEQVVLLRGYKLGITIMALIEGLPERHKHHYLNPLRASFYTDAYRWYLRHMSLIPPWIYGEAGSYAESVKLWKTRFMYADSFVPWWIQRLLFFIPASEWKQERKEFADFTKYAGATFAKQLRYNNKNKTKGLTNWWASHESKDSESEELPPEVTTQTPTPTPTVPTQTIPTPTMTTPINNLEDRTTEMPNTKKKRNLRNAQKTTADNLAGKWVGNGTEETSQIWRRFLPTDLTDVHPGHLNPFLDQKAQDEKWLNMPESAKQAMLEMLAEWGEDISQNNKKSRSEKYPSLQTEDSSSKEDTTSSAVWGTLQGPRMDRFFASSRADSHKRPVVLRLIDHGLWFCLLQVIGSFGSLFQHF